MSIKPSVMKSIVMNNIFTDIYEQHPTAQVKFGFCLGGGSDQSWYCAPYIYTVGGSFFPRIGVASGYVEEYNDEYDQEEYYAMNDLELDVIDMIGQGFSYDEIANQLNIPRRWVVFTAINLDELN